MAIETHHLDAHAAEYGSAEYWKQESQKNLADVHRLMARVADLEKLNHDLCDRVTENDEIRLHWEEIEQTMAENERLKEKLEDAKASAYAESVDAGMRERRLKRALWLAREWRALCEIDYWRKCYEHADDYFDVRTGQDLEAKRCERMISKWIDVKSKCLKKAEEYK